MYAIALCVDGNYLVPALVTISSVANVVPSRERADLAISFTTSDITLSQAGTVRDAVRRLGFGGCSIRRVRPPPDSWLRHGGYITGATYLRFALTDADVGRPHLVYLDADLMVLADLAGAFDWVESGHIGAVRDEIVQSIGRDQALPGFVDAYPHHRGVPYYNAGAIWLAADDLSAFRAGALDQLRHNARHVYFNDQDALNLWLLAEGCVASLPAGYNRFELGRFRERSDWINRAVGPAQGLADAKVIHFVGSHKPWLRSCPHTEAVVTYLGLLAETRPIVGTSRRPRSRPTGLGRRMTPGSDAAALVARRIVGSGSGQVAISKVGGRVYRVAVPSAVLVVKFFELGETRAFRREVDGVGASRPVGRWVPRLLGAGSVGSGHHYVAYREIAGVSLHRVADEGEVSGSEALRILGRVLRRFHNQTRRAFGPVTGNGAPDGGAYLATLVAERARFLDRHGLPALVAVLDGLVERWKATLRISDQAVLCHGDLHLDNVIVVRSAEGFRVNGVVDYESVVFALPEFDLAKVLVVCSAFGQGERRELLAGYAREVNLGLLTDLVAFHIIDGWLWAALIEGRDRQLWAERLRAIHRSPGVPSLVRSVHGLRGQSPS